jgi:hypothetical protein
MPARDVGRGNSVETAGSSTLGPGGQQSPKKGRVMCNPHAPRPQDHTRAVGRSVCLPGLYGITLDVAHLFRDNDLIVVVDYWRRANSLRRVRPFLHGPLVVSDGLRTLGRPLRATAGR